MLVGDEVDGEDVELAPSAALVGAPSAPLLLAPELGGAPATGASVGESFHVVEEIDRAPLEARAARSEGRDRRAAPADERVAAWLRAARQLVDSPRMRVVLPADLLRSMSRSSVALNSASPRFAEASTGADRAYNAVARRHWAQTEDGAIEWAPAYARDPQIGTAVSTCALVSANEVGEAASLD